MVITKIRIANFRGIKEATIDIPEGQRFLCLIGPGDSTKSTILTALYWAFYPGWALAVSDSDFYCLDVSNPIEISVYFSEFPEDLLKQDKFGLYLVNGRGVMCDEEPGSGEEPSLHIKFCVDATLEPSWAIVNSKGESKNISASDRKLLSVNVVGSNCSKDLVWGRNSILQKYVDSSGTAKASYLEATRKVEKDVAFTDLDKIVPIIQGVGKTYGVSFKGDVKNHISFENSGYSSLISPCEGTVPLSTRGQGSQRLLSLGLNVNSKDYGSVVLIDEVESGLEPFRIRSLISKLKEATKTVGQVILTTHSPVSISECCAADLFVVRSIKGITEVSPCYSDDDALISQDIQGFIRSNPEAFLSRKIIVCEGKTEIGFARSIASYSQSEKGFSFAYAGVGKADGGGSRIFKVSREFLRLGYSVCLLMDSDAEDEEKEKEKFVQDFGSSAPVFSWNKGNSIEEQIFDELPDCAIQAAIDIAIDYKKIDSVRSALACCSAITMTEDGKVSFQDRNAKKMIGTIAKKKPAEWYKRIGLGESLGNVVIKNIRSLPPDSVLVKNIQGIINWALADD